MLKPPVADTNGIDEYDQLVNVKNMSINTDSFTTWETVLTIFFCLLWVNPVMSQKNHHIMRFLGFVFDARRGANP